MKTSEKGLLVYVISVSKSSSGSGSGSGSLPGKLNLLRGKGKEFLSLSEHLHVFSVVPLLEVLRSN